jgi:O-antigen/teichoic acid export membrane protein
LLVCRAINPAIFGSFSKAIWWLPLSLVLSGFAQILLYFSLRIQTFRTTSFAKFVQATGYAGSAIVIGSIRPFATGLIVSDIVGRAGAVAIYCTSLRRDIRSVFKRRSVEEFRQIIGRFRAFPLVSLPSALLNAGGGLLTPLLIYKAFDSAASGQYALAERSIGVPIALISQAVSQVYMATFSEALRHNSEHAGPLLRKLVWTFLKLGALPSLLLLWVAPIGFAWVFGAKWVLAGQLAQIMAPLYLVAFVVGPVNMTLPLLEQQNKQILWDTLRLILIAITWAYIFLRHVNVRSAIMLNTGANVIAYAIYLVMVFRVVSQMKSKA